MRQALRGAVAAMSMAFLVVTTDANTCNAAELENSSFRLTASLADGAVRLRLDDLRRGVCAADGPCFYHAAMGEGKTAVAADRLEQPSITAEGDALMIRGKLLGLDIEHRFTATKDRPWLEERIVVKNNTDHQVELSDLEIGMTLRVAGLDGKILPEFASDRLAAVPFLHRAHDAKGVLRDYPLQEIVDRPGFEPRMNQSQGYSETPSRHRPSEGWAWTRGGDVLGVFKFCQEHLQFSVVSTHRGEDGVRLRFGGAAMLSGEPADLGRMAPGAAVDLGMVRYVSLAGGHAEACYAFRAMLDENGCRFPKDFNPPVHWEQLYDMPEAWNDRPRRYTKALLEREAAKGKAFSCEALYLDPGWDSDFGTFLWGEQWLGPRKQFIEEMQSKYGLKVALHCPLASWVSHSFSWGPTAVKTYPAEARRIAPEQADDGRLSVPAVRQGRRNLALSATAKAGASSVYADGVNPNHQIAHLNDGWRGNNASWIPSAMPAWAEIDLGAAHRISEVWLGNDDTGTLKDRAPTKLRVLTATTHAADSNAAEWHEAAVYAGEGIRTAKRILFAPVRARWVRIEIAECRDELPRLDEIEVYEAEPASKEQCASFEREARRGPKPRDPAQGPSLCLGSKQYLDVAAERLRANCADGVVYLMFDGNWWNGGCNDPNHGHPVPYRMEDHIRANLDLCRRVHEKYPKVLIEMHDMIAGGSQVRFTPIYYKYGLPGSYDMNWGFELMWSPMADIVEGRTAALYYANLGSNVPFYTHVNIAHDNAHCIVLWWYASTCRHLGIGGLHKDPKVVEAQQAAMRWYRQYDRFYKRGEFYGLSEEIHLHVLPEENAFTVNVFNLSGEKKTVRGAFDLKRMGLDPSRKYVSAEGLGRVENGRFSVEAELPPWGTGVAAWSGK